jgi:hypothetical protein
VTDRMQGASFSHPVAMPSVHSGTSGIFSGSAASTLPTMPVPPQYLGVFNFLTSARLHYFRTVLRQSSRQHKVLRIVVVDSEGEMSLYSVEGDLKRQLSIPSQIDAVYADQQIVVLRIADDQDIVLDFHSSRSNLPEATLRRFLQVLAAFLRGDAMLHKVPRAAAYTRLSREEGERGSGSVDDDSLGARLSRGASSIVRTTQRALGITSSPTGSHEGPGELQPPRRAASGGRSPHTAPSDYKMGGEAPPALDDWETVENDGVLERTRSGTAGTFRSRRDRFQRAKAEQARDLERMPSARDELVHPNFGVEPNSVWRPASADATPDTFLVDAPPMLLKSPTIRLDSPRDRGDAGPRTVTEPSPDDSAPPSALVDRSPASIVPMVSPLVSPVSVRRGQTAATPRDATADYAEGERRALPQRDAHCDWEGEATPLVDDDVESGAKHDEAHHVVGVLLQELRNERVSNMLESVVTDMQCREAELSHAVEHHKSRVDARRSEAAERRAALDRQLKSARDNQNALQALSALVLAACRRRQLILQHEEEQRVAAASYFGARSASYALRLPEGPEALAAVYPPASPFDVVAMPPYMRAASSHAASVAAASRSAPVEESGFAQGGHALADVMPPKSYAALFDARTAEAKQRSVRRAVDPGIRSASSVLRNTRYGEALSAPADASLLQYL